MAQAQIEERKQYLEAAQAAQYLEAQNAKKNLLKTITDNLEKELNLDCLCDDNVIAETPKKKIRRNLKSNYSSTKVKALNFLTNALPLTSSLRNAIKKNAATFQYLYTNLFPRYFSRIDDYGIRSKSTFENQYKFYLGQKNFLSWMEYPNPTVVKTELELLSGC